MKEFNKDKYQKYGKPTYNTDKKDFKKKTFGDKKPFDKKKGNKFVFNPKTKVSKVVQSISIKGSLYASGNNTYTVQDKLNALLKELSKSKIALAYSPQSITFSYYDATKKKEIIKEKITVCYLIEEAKLEETAKHLAQFVKYLDTNDINSQKGEI